MSQTRCMYCRDPNWPSHSNCENDYKTGKREGLRSIKFDIVSINIDAWADTIRRAKRYNPGWIEGWIAAGCEILNRLRST